jgi:hypothetical protein
MSKVVNLPVPDHLVGELVDGILDLVYSYETRVSLAAAIGALEVAKKVILDSHIDMGEEQ